MSQNKLSYKDAGVDIDAGEALVEKIKTSVKKTAREETIGGLGGFAALCRIPKGYESPILVSATDGVGTKLMLAKELDNHSTIGQDLVAMCVNDLIVCGAEPLFFLDYYATGKLKVHEAAQVINGIADGCSLAGCALIGGETAEMPGMYKEDEYDLAGFCTGVVEEEHIISGSRVQDGDILIALPSSGAHSNGYSLIRKILSTKNINLKTHKLGSESLADLLLKPTKIYVKPILNLLKEHKIIKAMAHITGGGLIENIPRVLPDNCQAIINTNSWEMPELFKFLQKEGNIDTTEMFRVFNCGVGMVICVATQDLAVALEALQELKPFVIGNIESSTVKNVVLR